MTEKEIREQLKLILNEIEEGNKTGEIFNDAGVAYYLLGEYEKSMYYLKNAVDKNRNSSYLFNLANTYSQLNQPDFAIVAYLQVLDLDAAHTGALNNLADEYERMGNSENAHELFHYLTLIHPNEAISHFNLGSFLLRQNQHIEAARCYETAIKKEPGFTDAYYNIAWLLYKAMAYDESLKYVNEGLNTESDHTDLLNLKRKLKEAL